MSKIQNTFVKSKMNKDLDDRLLSNGEYREAKNVSVSRSEGDDVGALENVLGNKLLTSFNLDDVTGLTCIGFYTEIDNSRIFAFLTNFSDTSNNQISIPAPSGAYCAIAVYDLKNESFQILINNSFLNFSTTHNVLGIDLIEDLLFWTDNRNQPRKININRAMSSDANSTSPYYTNSDQISVAKYFPYNAPFLHNTTVRNGSINNNVFTIVGLLGTSGLTEGMYLQFQNQPDNVNIQVLEIIDSSSLEVSAINLITGLTVSISNVNSSITFIDSSMVNRTEEWLPPSFSLLRTGIGGTTNPAAGTFLFTVRDFGAITSQSDALDLIKPGMKISCGSAIPENTYILSRQALGGSEIQLSLNQKINSNALLGELIPGNPAPPNPATAQIMFHEQNPYYNANFVGDSDFLKDKFVRFGYRYKFDDGEYSLISPFTQPAFIPKQDGYILSVPTKQSNAGNPVDTQTNAFLLSQECEIGSSSIVSFFENKVNEVGINITTPTSVNKLNSELKIIEIDILYKESNGLAVKVLDTISTTDPSLITNSSNILKYDYQSRRPTKVLPAKDITRVYDKIPVRAKTQSSSGNRIIYGNFFDRQTPPLTLDFGVGVSSKCDASSPTTKTSSLISTGSKSQYPNHTLKQNRTYQVGIVLSDKYGRQSDVILSSIGNEKVIKNGISFSGSTIYAPYEDVNPFKWFGNSLKILFEDKIPNVVDYAGGYPGLYSDGIIKVNVVSQASTGGAADVYTLSSWNNEISVGQIVSGRDLSGSVFNNIITSINASNKTIQTDPGADLSIIGGIGPSINILSDRNELGWYSYKVVVKQAQQDYYNAYVPGILSGEPRANIARPGLTASSSSSYITLISDNINKIPADLAQVQPQQTQFRTSDTILYPRVATSTWVPNINTENSTAQPFRSPPWYDWTAWSIQYNLGTNFCTVPTLGKLTDLSLNTVFQTGTSCVQINQTLNNIPKSEAETEWLIAPPGAVFTRALFVSYGTPEGSCGAFVLGTCNSTALTTSSVQEPQFVGKSPYEIIDSLIVGKNQVELYASDQLFGDPCIGISKRLYVEAEWAITNTDLASGPPEAFGVYNAKSNPVVGKLSTNSNLIGAAFDNPIFGGSSTNPPFRITEEVGYNAFGVLEVKPPESAIDIYWETSTSGLISDLNNAIENDTNDLDGTPGGVKDSSGNNTALGQVIYFDLKENVPTDSNITNTFEVVDTFGTVIPFNDVDLELLDVLNGNGSNQTFKFKLQTVGSSFVIKTSGISSLNGSYFGFLYSSTALAVASNNEQNVFTFRVKATSKLANPPFQPQVYTIINRGLLTNIAPSFTIQPPPINLVSGFPDNPFQNGSISVPIVFGLPREAIENGSASAGNVTKHRQMIGEVVYASTGLKYDNLVFEQGGGGLYGNQGDQLAWRCEIPVSAWGSAGYPNGYLPDITSDPLKLRITDFNGKFGGLTTLSDSFTVKLVNPGVV